MRVDLRHYYAERRLAETIFDYKLYENIKDFLSNNELSIFEINSINFVALYYPDRLNDNILLGLIEDTFDFLAEKSFEYEIENCSKESTATIGLLHDLQKYHEEEELLANRITEYNAKNKNKNNPLYTGQKGYMNTMCYWLNEIKPKSSLLQNMIDIKRSGDKHSKIGILYSDFLLKRDYVEAALEGNDKEYNQLILGEYFYLCKLVTEGKYTWNEDEESVDSIVNSLLAMPKIVAINTANTEKRKLKKIVWSYDSILCFNELYSLTKDQKVRSFMLKCIMMYSMIIREVDWQEIERKWDSIQILDDCLLIDKYEKELNLLYENVKISNEKLKKEIDIEASTYNIFVEDYDLNDTKLYDDCEGYIENLSVCPPDGDCFKLWSSDPYRKWLYNFFNSFNKKSDEHFRDNKSYRALMIDRENNNDDMYGNQIAFEKFPPDYDFSQKEKEWEYMEADRSVKEKVWAIQRNKINLFNCYNIYLLLGRENKKKNEIEDYLFNSFVNIEDKIYDELCIMFVDTISEFSSPTELVKHLSVIKKNVYRLDTNAIIKKPYLKFIDCQMDKISSVVEKWENYEPQKNKVQNHLNSFFEKNKPNIVKMYGKNKFDYEEIKKTTMAIITTGETLYNNFVSQSLGIDDYSVVAINYYRGLEYLLNHFFYIPYRECVLDNVLKKIIDKKRKSNKDFRGKDIGESDVIGYYGGSFKNITEKKGEKIYNLKTITLGCFAYLFSLEKKGKSEGFKYFIQYLKEKNVDTEKIKIFSHNINAIKDLRNECAHPSSNNESFAVRGRIAIYKKEDEDKALDEKRAKGIFEMILKIGDLFI